MRRHAVTIGRALALGALALTDVLLLTTSLVAAVLAALGLVFFFMPMIGLVRRRTMLARRLTGAWLGVATEPPYLPPPPPPRPQPDGWYRHERQLYRTPRWPAWHDRWKWMFTDPATWRDLAWLWLNPLVGGSLLLLPLAAVWCGLDLLWRQTPLTVPSGVAVIVAGVAAVPWLLRLYGWWTHLCLAPTARSVLAGRVRRLDQLRTETADSQAAELRRIERDLHDGAQARLVAMGMTLGAVEELMDKDPGAAKVLLAKAREASSVALTELRDLVRGIHPPVLAERGLGDAVRAMALDSPLKVTVTADLGKRPAAPVESAVYFSISELLTNAARHGGADRVWIDIGVRDGALRVTVTDDGSGGADPARGSGLRGVERRLAAFDGVLALNSPPGGPTTATIDLPLAGGGDASEDKVPLRGWRRVAVALGWGLGWLPLFPQGLVAMSFKIFGSDERSWFLALYLPGPLQWPMIVFNVLLGLAMYGAAMAITSAHSHRRLIERAGPALGLDG
ncbi:sensor histidine kinase [Streptosporangium pseudovulgare]|uniref:sensor histidine kinase n=1 Tax=Streptosporangium pseudovulgare TaxID=35765 RepID=UPI001670D03E|nr:histidine kinase [Streptosporangium pseudovulgare]